MQPADQDQVLLPRGGCLEPAHQALMGSDSAALSIISYRTHRPKQQVRPLKMLSYN